MYNFTTLHIINKLENPRNNTRYWNTNNTYQGKVTASVNPKLTIQGYTFNKDNVINISKKSYVPSKEEYAIIDFSNVGDSISPVYIGKDTPIYVGNNIPVGALITKKISYRLTIELELEKTLSVIFANRLNSNKDLTIYVEFEANPGDTIDTILTNINNIVEKYKLTTIGSDELVSFDKTTSGQLKISVSKPNMHISTCKIEEYKDTKYVPASGINIIKNEGVCGFGNWKQIIEEVRLVTTSNTCISSPYNDEMPLENGNYTQYVIYTKTPRKHFGKIIESITKHILWVNNFNIEIEGVKTTSIEDLDTVLSALVGKKQ